MSARQPFVPQGRPPARPSPKTATSQADDGSSLGRKNNPQDSAAEAPLSGIDKPLNISGFAKRKNAQGSENANGRKNAGDTPARARSPKMPARGGGKASAHSPFFASNSGVVSTSSFRMPQTPGSTSSTDMQSEISASAAHISTSGDDNDSTKPPSRFVSQNSVRSRVSSRSSLERINEEPNEGAASPRGYPRDAELVEEQDMRGSTAPLSPTYYEEEDALSGHPALRRVHKRIDQAELEFSPAKRRRVSEPKDVFAEPESDGLGTPPPPPPFTYPPLRTPSPPPYMRASTLSQDGQVLHKLLGHDLDVYANAHQVQYEQARKRWAECSMEEWKAGADGLTVQFASLIDFVKDHMVSKLKLHTTLHASLADHRTVLTERDTALKNVRETLVRDGGNVVTGRIAPATFTEKTTSG